MVQDCMFIGTILLLVKLHAEDLASLCIQRGDLSWAMRIGIFFFVTCLHQYYYRLKYRAGGLFDTRLIENRYILIIGKAP